MFPGPAIDVRACGKRFEERSPTRLGALEAESADSVRVELGFALVDVVMRLLEEAPCDAPDPPQRMGRRPPNIRS